MHSARIITVWVCRREAHLTLDGPSADDLPARLEQVLNLLLSAGADHVVVDLHRLTGHDGQVLELLAASCHRLWSRRGTLDVHGLRDRLVSRPEVHAFPELFGNVHPAGDGSQKAWRVPNSGPGGPPRPTPPSPKGG